MITLTAIKIVSAVDGRLKPNEKDEGEL